MGRLFAVEIIYRGIFQKTMAGRISRGIVLAAHQEGKPGISFGRYGDSPERNGIPAKSFAIVATDQETLEEGMAKYEPKEVDITICVDDTLCKGVESWAWYGLQPVNQLLKPGGTLIVTSREGPEAIIAMAHRKEYPYQLCIVKGTVSFSGLWVYKDDHTDVRILGTIASILPDLFSLKSVKKIDCRRVERCSEGHLGCASPTSASRASRFVPTRAIRKRLTSSTCPSGMRWARAWPFPASRRTADRRSRHPCHGRLPARSQSHLQEVQHADHAAGGEFRHLHQVHAVLAAVSGLLLRRYSRGSLRRQHAGLLRLRRLRGRLPGAKLRHHGQRDGIPATTPASGRRGGRTKHGYKTWLQEKIESQPERSHGFRYRGQYEEQIPEMLEIAQGKARTLQAQPA